MYDIYPCFQRVLLKCLIICIYNTHVLFTSPKSHSLDVDSAIEVNKIAMIFVLSEKVIKSSLNLKISLSCAFKHKGCKISAQAPAKRYSLFAETHKTIWFCIPTETRCQLCKNGAKKRWQSPHSTKFLFNAWLFWNHLEFCACARWFKHQVNLQRK